MPPAFPHLTPVLGITLPVPVLALGEPKHGSPLSGPGS